MARRIRHQDIAEQLAEADHEESEFGGGDWDHGFACDQHGPRIVHLVHYGPGETEHFAAYTTTLHRLGYAVTPEQERGGRRRLAVTLP
ncbi:hypothetical protein ACFVWX_29060 [Streptomyces sp. NPDC058220]|uniref:hypothetical protein n=1 Tax=Streptomyces sp. NPDC058220 TaxID=3346387 RepID=UPI0036E710B4